MGAGAGFAVAQHPRTRGLQAVPGLPDVGDLAANRADQARHWLWSETAEYLMARLRDDPAVRERIAPLEAAVGAGRIAPRVAAEQLVTAFWTAERKQ